MGVVADLKDAVGRDWERVVVEFGVDPSVLDGHHHPCPVCGGRDRFRVTNRTAGHYYCNWCRQDTNGHGDWLNLLVDTTGMSVAEAIKLLASRYGIDKPERQRPRRQERSPVEASRDLLRSSVPAVGTLAESYLMQRGLSLCPAEIRFADRVYETDTHSSLPAMLVPVRNESGELVSVHRTYLAPDGTKAMVPSPRKLMPTDGQPRVMAAPLFWRRGADTVVVTEGVETGLAVRQLGLVPDAESVPVFAAISATGVEKFVPPASVRRVFVCGDHDENGVGQAAAWRLVSRMRRAGLECPDPLIPGVPGDWLDALVVAVGAGLVARGAENF